MDFRVRNSTRPLDYNGILSSHLAGGVCMSLVLSLAFPMVTAKSTIASLASSSSVVALRTQR